MEALRDRDFLLGDFLLVETLRDLDFGPGLRLRRHLCVLISRTWFFLHGTLREREILLGDFLVVILLYLKIIKL